MNMIKTRPLLATLFSLLFVSLLSGCGSDSGENSSSNKAATVTLVIVNQEGDISQGELIVQDGNKEEILKLPLDGAIPYLLKTPAGVKYPILVTVKPNSTVYTKFNDPLKALVVSTLSSKIRVSQKSTSAVEYITTQLGAVFSKENIAKATMATMTPDHRPARSYKGGMAKISGK